MDDMPFFEWMDTIKLYFRELVLLEIVTERKKKGRALTEEELNEIRKKYDHDESEENNDGNDEAETPLLADEDE